MDGQPVVRASDAERERVAAALREHVVDGRLSMEEFNERLDEAYAARTTGELAAVLHELPDVLAEREAQTTARRRREAEHAEARRGLVGHVRSYVAVMTLLLGIWAATALLGDGNASFWPAWPALAWGIGLASHAAGVLTGRDDGHRGRCGLPTPRPR